MKKICSSGFRISAPDRKALEEYLLKSPRTWADSALKGMINKAIKSIMKDWFEIYKSKQSEDITADYAIIISGIIAMEDFKPYNVQTPAIPQVTRKEASSEEIWENGFDIDDYEDMALRAFYKDPEEMLRYYMKNKIYLRRKAFIKDHEKKFFETKQNIPKDQDDFINNVCAKPEYKKRSVREEEKILMGL